MSNEGVKATTGKGLSALHLAAGNGMISVCKELLDDGRIGVNDIDISGRTARDHVGNHIETYGLFMRVWHAQKYASEFDVFQCVFRGPTFQHVKLPMPYAYNISMS